MSDTHYLYAEIRPGFGNTKKTITIELTPPGVSKRIYLQHLRQGAGSLKLDGTAEVACGFVNDYLAGAITLDQLKGSLKELAWAVLGAAYKKEDPKSSRDTLRNTHHTIWWDSEITTNIVHRQPHALTKSL